VTINCAEFPLFKIPDFIISSKISSIFIILELIREIGVGTSAFKTIKIFKKNKSPLAPLSGKGEFVQMKFIIQKNTANTFYW